MENPTPNTISAPILKPINESPAPPDRRLLGPGLIMAASGMGASDIIAATVGGATYGVTLCWALLVGAFFKFVLTEGLARWQLATDTTLLEGWARHLPRWALALFMAYMILWAVAVSGALVGGCGLAIENITRGAVPRTYGALAHAAIAFGLIYSARAGMFSRVMKPLIIVMFFTIIACALATFREPMALFKGILTPTIPTGGGAYVLSLIGGIGGSLTLLSYNYLLRDDKKVEASNLKNVRIDLALAYLFTALFGLSVILIANRVFHSTGQAITDGAAVAGIAGELSARFGKIGFYAYSLGFWAAVLASLFGVWQTVPTLFADCYCLLRRMPEPARAAATKPSSWQYRAALAFMATVSVPFAFFDRPLQVVVAFTIIGSLFIPFLAATLLYLNNRVPWAGPIRRNHLATNVALILVLLLFLVIGGLEIYRGFAAP